VKLLKGKRARSVLEVYLMQDSGPVSGGPLSQSQLRRADTRSWKVGKLACLYSLDLLCQLRPESGEMEDDLQRSSV
jgi:hypothetical protein